jgi:hypothetical protein
LRTSTFSITSDIMAVSYNWPGYFGLTGYRCGIPDQWSCIEHL